jgi:hypothetical protein
MIEGDMATAPYLRHKEHMHVYDDHHSAEYDADDEDIAWLDKINSKVRATLACCSSSSSTGQQQHRQQGMADVSPWGALAYDCMCCSPCRAYGWTMLPFVLGFLCPIDAAVCCAMCCEQGGQSTGILAAAIGLYHQVSARISRSSDHSTGSEVGKQDTSSCSVRAAVEN